jgi:hypothetical protein
VDLVSVEVVSSDLRPVLVRRTHLPLPVGIEGSARHAHKRHAAQTVAGELARYKDTGAATERCDEEAVRLILRTRPIAPPLGTRPASCDAGEEVVHIV